MKVCHTAGDRQHSTRFRKYRLGLPSHHHGGGGRQVVTAAVAAAIRTAGQLGGVLTELLAELERRADAIEPALLQHMLAWL